MTLDINAYLVYRCDSDQVVSGSRSRHVAEAVAAALEAEGVETRIKDTRWVPRYEQEDNGEHAGIPGAPKMSLNP